MRVIFCFGILFALQGCANGILAGNGKAVKDVFYAEDGTLQIERCDVGGITGGSELMNCKIEPVKKK